MLCTLCARNHENSGDRPALGESCTIVSSQSPRMFYAHICAFHSLLKGSISDMRKKLQGVVIVGTRYAWRSCCPSYSPHESHYVTSGPATTHYWRDSRYSASNSYLRPDCSVRGHYHIRLQNRRGRKWRLRITKQAGKSRVRDTTSWINFLKFA
jgi:hypothetical protein